MYTKSNGDRQENGMLIVFADRVLRKTQATRTSTLKSPVNTITFLKGNGSKKGTTFSYCELRGIMFVSINV